MSQKRIEERPYRMMGRTSVVAECPFCGKSGVITLGGKRALSLEPIRITSKTKLCRFVQAVLDVIEKLAGKE